MNLTNLFFSVVFASVAAVPAAAFATDDAPLNARAKQLGALREEVSSLTLDIDAAKESTRSRLQSLDAQQSDLSVQQGRADFQLEAMRKEQVEKQARLAASTSDPAYRDALLQSAARLRTRIERGLPFRTQQRLDALDELTARIEQSQLTAQQAMARLWAFTEDELRLARENGRDRQVITLAGRDVMVDVVRLGMVALYFETPDNRVGTAVRNGQEWLWVEYDDANSISLVHTLFEGFERGLRTGVYTIPNPITEAQR